MLRTVSGTLVCAAAAIIIVTVTRKGGQEALSPLGQFQSHLSYQLSVWLWTNDLIL